MIRDLVTLLHNRQQKEPQPLEWTPELVERFWDGIRETRLNELSFSRQAGRALVVAVAHLLSEEAEILDFGAGDGTLISLLLERGHRVSGYEPSPKRRAVLQERFAHHPGFKGLAGPGHRTGFDVVLMVEVIEHILDSDFDAVLGQVRDLTKPGGVVVITTPNSEDLALGMCYDPMSNTMFHRWQHVRSFSPTTIVETMSRFGFAEVATHQLELHDQLYVPFDERWGGTAASLPGYLVTIRRDESTPAGSRQNLVYVGRRRS